jgi:hypothetical protein
MLSKALVFVFTTLGVFAVLMNTMPLEFRLATFNPSYTNPAVKQQFEAADVISYKSLGQDNMTYPYSSLANGPEPPDWEAGLPSGQYCEVWWNELEILGLTLQCIQVRHVTRQWWGNSFSALQFKYANGTVIPNILTVDHDKITKDILVSAWDDEKGYSAFYAYGSLTCSILFYPTNRTQTIAQAWDAGKISYSLSYEVNWNQTGINAWTIVAQLLTFQVPNLGVEGPAGTILSMVIAFPFLSLMAYIVYKIIAGLIPFLSGGSGD